MKTIKQELPVSERVALGNKIIDMLENCNLADKWQIIDSLHTSLKENIKNEGGVIFTEIILDE